MVSDNTPRDSHRASRRSFLGALGLAAGTAVGSVAGAQNSDGQRQQSDADLQRALGRYAVPVPIEGDALMRQLFPAVAHTTPPSEMGTVMQSNSRKGTTAVASRLQQHPIVGLGESTHGTSEFQAIRRRIVQQLVAEYDLRVVGFEASFAGVASANEFLVHGEGSVDDALAALGSWIWQTEEVRKLLVWLREFNRGRLREDRVEIHGIDAQLTQPIASEIVSYLDDAGIDVAADARSLLEMLAGTPMFQYFYGEGRSVREDRIPPVRDAVETVRTALTDGGSTAVDATSERGYRFALQYLRCLEIAMNRLAASADGIWAGFEARDVGMAENVTWLLEELHSDQVAFWGHSNHVKRGTYLDFARTLGDFLEGEHGEDYYAMGMDFGSGSFTARVRGEPGFQTPSIDSPEADLASFLAELAPSEFFVDLDAASAYRPLADWLDSDHEFHAVGAVWLPENHVDTHHLTQSFDGMVFVETGTPTSLRLGGPQASGDGEEDDSEDTATAG